MPASALASGRPSGQKSIRLVELPDETWSTVVRLGQTLRVSESEVLQRAVAACAAFIPGNSPLGPAAGLAAWAAPSKAAVSCVQSSAGSSGWATLPESLARTLYQKLANQHVLRNVRLINKHWKGLIATHTTNIDHGGRGCTWYLSQSEIVALTTRQALTRCWDVFPNLRALTLQLCEDDGLAHFGLSQMAVRLPGLQCLRLKAGHQRPAATPLEALCRLAHLDELELESFRLPIDSCAVSATALRRCSSITKLRLVSCTISSLCLAPLESMPELKSLELRLIDSTTNKRVSPAVQDIFRTIGACTRLQRLVISGLTFGGRRYRIADHHLLHLQGLNTLAHLEMDGIANVAEGLGITGEGMAALLSHMTSLTTLSILELEVTDQLLQAVAQNTSMSTLHLSGYGPHVSPNGAALASLEQLLNLQDLCLCCKNVAHNVLPECIWFKGRRLEQGLQSMPGPSTVTLLNTRGQQLLTNLITMLHPAGGSIKELTLRNCDGISESVVRCLHPLPLLASLIVDTSSLLVAETKWNSAMLKDLQPLSNLLRLNVKCLLRREDAAELLPQVLHWDCVFLGFESTCERENLDDREIS